MASTNVTLNNGNKMPSIGLGTGTHYDKEAMYQATRDAISAGYRHFDTAAVYGTETFVGRAVNDAITAGEVKREDLFITTKLWINSMKREQVIPSLRESLKQLQLDYVDLYLIHWPCPIDGNNFFGADVRFDNEIDIYTQTWQGMEEAVADGLAKNIGVSNFNSKQIDELLKVAKIAPVVNQVECHPFLCQRKLIDHCSKYGIVLTAYSPFGGSPIIDTEQAEAFPYINFDVRKGLFDNETLISIAKQHNKNVGHILLKFQVQRGLTVIPKSVTKSRIVDNLNIFDFKLTKEELSQLESLNQNLRFAHLSNLRGHVNYPFNAEY